MIDRGEWTHEDGSEKLDPNDGVEATDFDEVTEAVQRFDIARDELYAQAVRIKLGGGGDSMVEAVENLTKLQKHTAVLFGEVGEAIIDDSSDMDVAIEEILHLYLRDEEQRIEIMKHFQPDGKYERVDEEYFRHRVERMILQASDELPLPQQLCEWYANCNGSDLNVGLSSVPPNIVEERALQRALRRERIMMAARDIGIMVGAAAMATVVSTAILDRRK